MAKKSKKGANKGRRDYPALTVTASATYDPRLDTQQYAEEGRRRKSWTLHDLRHIQPLTQRQRDAFEHWAHGNSLVLGGAAGTGKTLSALYLAFDHVLNSGLEGVTIVRSAVQTRDLGHLKGDLGDKLAPYAELYKDMLAFLFKGRPNTYRDMEAAGFLQFESTSFLRGKTFANRVVIADESQNMTFHEIETVVTRMGEGARLIFVADPAQNDLKDLRQDSGYQRALERFDKMRSVSRVHFLPEDNVRKGLSREWLLAGEKTQLKECA